MDKETLKKDFSIDPDGERLYIMKRYKEMNQIPENATPKPKEYIPKHSKK